MISEDLLEFLNVPIGTEENEITTETVTGNARQQLLKAFDAVLFKILFTLLSKTAGNARVAHRTKINVFDVTGALQSLQMSIGSLTRYLNWTRGRKTSLTLRRAASTASVSLLHQELKLNLTFGLGLDPKRIATDYYPPIPPTYTYKSTPVSELGNPLQV